MAGENGDPRACVRDGRATITIRGRDFLFRLPDLEDIIVVNREYPVLPVLEEAEDAGDHKTVIAKVSTSTEELLAYMQRVNHMLELCALRPRLVHEFSPDAQDGLIPVRALHHNDRIKAHTLLWNLAQSDAEADVSLRPFSTGTSLSSSTASGSDTGSSPAKSSPATG